jgi:IMP cyclohydrolase
MQALQIAETNLERHLRRNPYPERGLIVGRSSAQDAWLMIYLYTSDHRDAGFAK